MALEGAVKDFGVVDIFQLIAMQKKSGNLTLSRDDKSVVVSFVNGNIIKAVEGDENERLSNALITAEKITMIQLRAALRVTEKEAPLGDTLVNLAYITSEEVKGWNQTLTQETVFDLLSWEAGSYRFEQQDLFSKSDHYVQIGVERILMEGMRQKDEWPGLLKKIPSKGTVFELVERPNEEADPFLSQYQTNGEDIGPIAPLVETEEHAWLLKWIDGVRSVEGIVNHAGVGAFPVYKCLAELLADGRLKKIEIKPAAPKRWLFFQRLKETLFNDSVFNKLFVSLVVVVMTTFFLPSFYGVKSVFQKIRASLDELRQFNLVNQKDVIMFSLNLYYLKHNRYPETLPLLREDGFMNTEQEREIDLKAFLYQSDGKTYEITPLTQ